MPPRTNTAVWRPRWRRMVGVVLGVAAAAFVIWLARGGSPSKAVGSGLDAESIQQRHSEPHRRPSQTRGHRADDRATSDYARI